MGVVENVKDVAELVKKMGDIELYKKILALEMEVMELTRDKRRADEKIEELERMLNLQSELKFDAPFYWLADDRTPFCTACWEGHRKAAHLVVKFEHEAHARLDCPTCKHEYVIEGVRWRNVSGKHR